MTVNRYNLPVPAAQPLKPRDLRRVQRNALPPVDRAMLWPVDQFELEQQQRRTLFYLDCVLGVVFGLIALCLIGVVLGI